MSKQKKQDQAESLAQLVKDLKAEDYSPTVSGESLFVTCPDASTCGRVWRRFYALKPQRMGVVLAYRKNGHMKSYGSSEPLRN